MSDEKDNSGEIIEGSSEVIENSGSTDNSGSSNPRNEQTEKAEANTASQNASNNEQTGNTGANQQSGSASMPNSNERNWAMFCHLSTLSTFLIPFFSVIGPLIIWLMKRDEMEYVNYHGKEALNFQITMAIAFLVSIVLMTVFIGFVLIPVVGIFWFVMSIIGAIKASGGERYEYPLSIRFIK